MKLFWVKTWPKVDFVKFRWELGFDCSSLLRWPGLVISINLHPFIKVFKFRSKLAIFKSDSSDSRHHAHCRRGNQVEQFWEWGGDQVSPFPNTSVKKIQFFYLVDLCSGTSSTLSVILTTHPPPYPMTPACSSLRFSSKFYPSWWKAVWHLHCGTVLGAFWMDRVRPAHCPASSNAGWSS